jgi:probable rRNA maturation factor
MNQDQPRSKKKPAARPRRQSASASKLRVVVSGADAELRRLAARAVRTAVSAEGRTSGHIEVDVIDDEEMRRLHHLWLRKDSTTDVLTFDLTEGDDPLRLDGQILVCCDVARREAAERGSDWRHELALYIVHGCLHLCGYDDHQVSGFRRMHRREDEILTKLGLGAVFSQPGSSDAGPRPSGARPKR